MTSALALEHLSKSYGPTKALSDFSLDIAAGEVVALVGENGAGKSTIAKLLAGAATPDSWRATCWSGWRNIKRGDIFGAT